MARARALTAAAHFVHDAGGGRTVVPSTGRPFVLDLLTREWYVVFREDADVYPGLLMGARQPRYRRVAVHAETGAYRWVEND